MADEETTEEGPKQTVSRMPSEAEVGPFFPSGMSATEAAMAGATAGMSDEDKEAVATEAAFLGVEPPA